MTEIYLLQIVQVNPPADVREPKVQLRFTRRLAMPFVPPTPFHFAPAESPSSRILINELVYEQFNNRFVCYKGYHEIPSETARHHIEKLKTEGWVQEYPIESEAPQAFTHQLFHVERLDGMQAFMVYETTEERAVAAVKARYGESDWRIKGIMGRFENNIFSVPERVE